MKGFKAAVAHAEYALSRTDPELARLIKAGPAFNYQAFNKAPFESLVHTIISQQLSLRSAAAIRQRVNALPPYCSTASPVLRVFPTSVRVL